MRKTLNNLLDLFFPKLCLLCNDPLMGGENHFCLKCLCNLPHTGFDYLKENPATHLFTGKVMISHAAAFLHYERGGHVQQLIHELKYNDNKEIGFRLGRMAGLDYRQAILSDLPDLILPVPLHPRKKKKRGYNQSEWIARGINSVLKLPVDTSSLCRIKQNETQTKKPVYDRWLNVQEIFTVANPQALEGKHILLIDDVITTGSTLGACAEALLTVPGVRVSVLAVAIA
ncbi:comF family protein [Parabacteroides sp. HGS0025]|jgi:ComF family protein|uniref:ComF family protein n=1 Tax=Parabacteroides sp. HGS0025 TaxID=1078087 RepID=UPI0006174619|nr:ComF family protein [Parabacteroides sp. HGS0025]KKB52308.1 comF family protein [Parabacteroides sp. HGS0025]